MPEDPLDPDAVVVAGTVRLRTLDQLIKEWPTGQELREEMYQRDLEREAKPPVLHVTVTPPEGHAIPPEVHEGHFQVTTGPNPQVTWHPEPDDTQPMRRVLPVTERAADKESTDAHRWKFPGGWRARDLRAVRPGGPRVSDGVSRGGLGLGRGEC